MRCSIVCPIDFSEASKGSLRYAVGLATEFDTELRLVHVDDPMLVAAMEIRTGPGWRHVDEGALRDFVASALPPNAAPPREMRFEVAVGKPAPEILRIAGDCDADLIVMSSHGRSGPSKWLLGSVTERVLRETSIPVLITPPTDPGPMTLERFSQDAKCVLAPVDFGEATDYQAGVAVTIAESLRVPLVFAHVISALSVPGPLVFKTPELDADRIHQARQSLDALLKSEDCAVPRETAMGFGEPADELARIATDRHAGLIIMALHSSPLFGPRMGSVTYRLLCLTRALTLALPPTPAAAQLVSALAYRESHRF